MSYYETVGGIGLRGFSEGMGAAFTVSTTPNEELRSIQQGLQHMGLLAPGTGSTGADGRWGTHTASALTQAKTRLHRTAAAFSVTNAGRNITIPDDFIAAIHAAAAEEVRAPLPSDTGPDTSATLPSSLPSTVVPPAVEETTEPSRMRLYVIGGSVLAIAAVAAAYMTRMRPNGRRRVRRNRRKHR